MLCGLTALLSRLLLFFVGRRLPCFALRALCEFCVARRLACLRFARMRYFFIFLDTFTHQLILFPLYEFGTAKTPMLRCTRCEPILFFCIIAFQLLLFPLLYQFVISAEEHFGDLILLSFPLQHFWASVDIRRCSAFFFN